MTPLTKSDLTKALLVLESNIFKKTQKQLDSTIDTKVGKMIDTKIGKMISDSEKIITKNFNDRLGEATNVILNTMEEKFAEERDYNTKTFTAKTELQYTKDELKTEISWTRNDIKDLEALLSDKPNRKQFEEYKFKVDNFMTN